MKRIKTIMKTFTDEDENQIILNGINLVCKEKSRGYIGDYTEEDFKKLKRYGFNVIRLGLIWDGIEPKPGTYDDNYINNMIKIIDMARENDIYVFLDMHQDLFSVKYSDGAPEWATLCDDANHPEELAVWSDAYLLSEAVQKSFDSFWNNRLAEDGIGLQDHYAKAWAHIISKVKDYDNIIGFDIMNEPFVGTRVEEVFGRLLEGYAAIVLKDNNINEEELISLWFDVKKKEEFLGSLSNMEVYKQLIGYSQTASQNFEKEFLMPFYNKVTKEILKICSDKAIFTESCYFSNMGMESGIERLDDVNQVYAPHGYDLIVDTDAYDAYNYDRVEFIFNNHKNVQDRLGVPMLVGEWGAFYNLPNTDKCAEHIVKIFEENLWSNTYWSYEKGIESNQYFKKLVRAYPMSVSGELIEYSYSFDSNRFKCSYKNNGNVNSQTVIYHPNLINIDINDIKTSHTCTIKKEVINNSSAGYFYIDNINISEIIEIFI